MAFGLDDILGLLQGPGVRTARTAYGGGSAGDIAGSALGGGSFGGTAMKYGGKALSALGKSSFLFGKPESQEQIQRFTPEQQDAFSQLLQQGMGSVGGTGIDDLARKRFQEETIPSIAERFTSMGAGGQRSSAFQGALGRAGSDLEAQLAALGQQRGMQQLGMGLQPQFDTYMKPGQQGLLGGAAAGGSQALMQILPMLLKLLI